MYSIIYMFNCVGTLHIYDKRKCLLLEEVFVLVR